MNALRAIYKFGMTLIGVAVIVQIGAAGYGAFYSSSHEKHKTSVMTQHQFDHGWSFHVALGWITVYAILLALLLALIARIGRPRIWFQLGLAVAGVLQIVFALVGESHPAVGVLHPLNAFVILVLTGFLARLAWMPGRRVAA